MNNFYEHNIYVNKVKTMRDVMSNTQNYIRRRKFQFTYFSEQKKKWTLVNKVIKQVL